jgi:LmbE family N-acetylglucosaminyl deacetylase
MFVGAHPDDGEGKCGALAARYIESGGEALFVSMTNGNAGHHELPPGELARMRAAEAQRAAEVIGARYVVFDNDDGRLTPSVAAREELIGLIRQFKPDLLLGLRPFDYHPDHRAAGQLVVDASYMLTVPLIRPDVPHLDRMPVIAYVSDRFTRPAPFRPDIVLDASDYTDLKVQMLACHASQHFEWLPFNQGCLADVPAGEAERTEWLSSRLRARYAATAEKFRPQLALRYGAERAASVADAEAFEICEYGRQPDDALLGELFHG